MPKTQITSRDVLLKTRREEAFGCKVFLMALDVLWLTASFSACFILSDLTLSFLIHV